MATNYLLIGSGVAAVTIAGRLLEKDPAAEITILEAGRRYPAKDRRAWWDYVMTGKAAYSPGEDPKATLHEDFKVASNVQWDCDNNRVIAYGGSTLHWGGWSLRYKPEDFHLRTNTGAGADWPFGYDELHNYYYQAEQLLSVCGDDHESWNHQRIEQSINVKGEKKVTRDAQPYPMPPFEWTEADGEMIQAFRTLGIEPGRMPLARYRKCMATGTCKYCPLGARYTAQDKLDELLERYPHVVVKELCPTSRIVMNGKKWARGVKYLEIKDDGTATEQELEAERIVICAGAYESPKLLLASTSEEWQKGIGNDFDQVGRYLVSHSILRVLGVKANPDCWIQEYDFPTLMSRTFDTPEYQQHGKLFLFKNRKFPHLNFADAMIAGHSKQKIEDQLRGERIMELQAFLEEKGKFTNIVGLEHGQTGKHLPKTRIVYDRTDAEVADANSRLEILQRVIREMGYKIREAQVDRPGGHHATGTCRMSHRPQDGVTTPDLLVHGTRNLYVCSNAVMPTSAAVNPTLTLTALALRLGDHLLALDHRGPEPAAERPDRKKSNL